MRTKSQKILKLVLQTIIVIGLLFFAYYLTKIVPDSDAIQAIVQAFGYPGLFFISVLSGFNILVPIPVIAFFSVFTESGLQEYLVIAVISLGMTSGDFIGYLIGNTGRKITSSSISKKSFKAMEKLHDRNPKLPLIVLALYASLAPAPNELIVIPLAFLGYKIRYVMTILFLGNIVFNSLIAYGILGSYFF